MAVVKRKSFNGGLQGLADKLGKYKKITAQVGITQKSNKKYSPKQKGAPTIAQIAKWLEYGWVQTVTPKQRAYFGKNFDIHLKVGNPLVLPPRPFLRWTFDANIKKWERQFTNAITIGGKSVEDAMDMVAEEAEADIKDAINDGGVGGKTFEPRSPMTTELYRQKTKGHKTDGTGKMTGDTPLMAKGHLLGSIAHDIIKE